MTLHYFADKNADTVLIQPVGDHDLPEIENEVAEIKKLTSVDFQLIAVKVEDWNRELSPWEAPAVFGNEGFGNGAEDTLAEILTLCSDKSKNYYIGGYSLAGLFALWAAFQTEKFSGSRNSRTFCHFAVLPCCCWKTCELLYSRSFFTP